MLNLIDRDLFGDNVTTFMTEAMINHKLLLKTPMYFSSTYRPDDDFKSRQV